MDGIFLGGIYKEGIENAMTWINMDVDVDEGVC